MTEVNTLSALVDDTIARGGRPDRRNDIISYVRQTQRECQVMAFFQRDFDEDTITATTSPHLWTVPQEFRQMQTVRYGIVDPQNNFIYPKHVNPGKGMRNRTYFYYRGVTQYVFAGISAGVDIDLAFYMYFKKLAYYALADRPATFSLEDDAWSYHTDYDTDDIQRAIAQALVSNWMIFDWYDLLMEGVLAKLYKTVKDPRAPATFGLYKSLQKDLLAGEAIDSRQL